jgi:hypothetical protein
MKEVVHVQSTTDEGEKEKGRLHRGSGRKAGQSEVARRTSFTDGLSTAPVCTSARSICRCMVYNTRSVIELEIGHFVRERRGTSHRLGLRRYAGDAASKRTSNDI